MWRYMPLITLLASALLFWGSAESCNEAVCASVVSKCMLTGSCKCELKDCSCCQECFSCLSVLYSECCSCVDMCPKPNETTNELSKRSHVEDFTDPVPALFERLTEIADPEARWLSFTFPVDFNIESKHSIQTEYKLQSVDHQLEPIKHNFVTLNCTVSYQSQCLSVRKCKLACQSMGASKFRWFHDGCCECIGDNCYHYGINESRCLACPEDKEGGAMDPEDYPYEDDLDYGEGMGELDAAMDDNL